MYRVNDKENTIERVEESSFSKLGYREREHLQEWISKNPCVFGEELLIIQKEFCGFAETNERLDLLALDKDGNIVVIENKLDDSGRNIVWQSLKYASYCSQLTKQNIKELFQDYLFTLNIDQSAEEVLNDFFDIEDFEELQLNVGNTQRVIMVAAKFRIETTSTVLWLLNHRLRIQCFRVTPYVTDSERYINFEQIIPVNDVEDYIITMADKTQSDLVSQTSEQRRNRIRMEFWAEFIKQANDNLDLYQNVSPSKDSWISGATGISSVGFNCVITKNHVRVEVYLSRRIVEENKFLFDELFKRKDEIEKTFGAELDWERLDGKKACRIAYRLRGVNYFDKENWPQMIDFMVNSIERLVSAFKKPILEAGEEMRRNLT